MNYLDFHLINLREELTELYACRLLRALAFSLIGVFIPIYLLTLGFDFSTVVLYLIVKFSTLLVLSPLSLVFESRFGAKHAILSSTFVLTAFFAALYSIGGFGWPPLLLAFLQGLEMALYWISFNTDFALSSRDGHRGREYAAMNAIPEFVSVFGPLAGAVVITLFGFNSLIVIACAIVLSSAVPLFMTPERRFREKRFFKRLMKFDFKYFWLIFAEGVLSSSIILWPVYAYFISSSYLFVGGLTTAEAVAAMAITLAIGLVSDKVKHLNVLKPAGVLGFFVFASAAFVSQPIHALILAFFLGLAWRAIHVPVFAYFCDDCDKKHMAQLIVFREIALCAGRVALLAVVLLLIWLGNTAALQIAFGLTALVSLYFSLYGFRNARHPKE